MKKNRDQFDFDKFVKDIEKREKIAKDKIVEHQSNQESHPGRIYNKLYRELWQNRVKYRR